MSRAARSPFARAAAVFASGTMLSRVLGLVRDVVLAGFVPAVARDVFFLGFKFANLLRDMLGEGAANAALVPVLAEADERRGDAAFRRLAYALLWAMAGVLALVTVAGILLVPFVPALLAALQPVAGEQAAPTASDVLTVRVLQWTFPYLFFIGLTACAAAPLFVRDRYAVPGWSPALLNVALIAVCVVALDWFAQPVWALVAGVWLGGALQLAALLWALWRCCGPPRWVVPWTEPAVRRAGWLLLPVIVGQTASEVNKVVDNLFAYLLPAGTVSALFFANRLVQLPLSLFGVAVSVAVLPAVSRAGARADLTEARQLLLEGLRFSLFLVLPATVGLLLMAEPLIALLFEWRAFTTEEAARTSAAVFYYGLGLVAFAGVKILVAGFFALQDTRTPVVVATLSMLLNIALNFALVGPLGFRGLAIATTVAQTLNFALLYVLLSRRVGLLWSGAFGMGLARMLVCCVALGGAVYGARAVLPQVPGFAGELMAAGVPITLGGLTYLGCAVALGLPEAMRLRTLLRRK